MPFPWRILQEFRLEKPDGFRILLQSAQLPKLWWEYNYSLHPIFAVFQHFKSKLEQIAAEFLQNSTHSCIKTKILCKYGFDLSGKGGTEASLITYSSTPTLGTNILITKLRNRNMKGERLTSHCVEDGAQFSWSSIFAAIRHALSLV